jgi:hypothetical protein
MPRSLQSGTCADLERTKSTGSSLSSVSQCTDEGIEKLGNSLLQYPPHPLDIIPRCTGSAFRSNATRNAP